MWKFFSHFTSFFGLKHSRKEKPPVFRLRGSLVRIFSCFNYPLFVIKARWFVHRAGAILPIFLLIFKFCARLPLGLRLLPHLLQKHWCITLNSFHIFKDGGVSLFHCRHSITWDAWAKNELLNGKELCQIPFLDLECKDAAAPPCSRTCLWRWRSHDEWGFRHLDYE